MIEFITNNSVWFISGGILIILVVIGYCADKKGLGNKKVETVANEVVEEVKEEKVKPKKSKKQALDIDMDIPFVAEQIKEEKKEDLNVPVDDSNSLDEFSSNGSTDGTSSLEEYAVNEKNKEEDLNVPFGDQKEVLEQDVEIKEETKSDEIKEEKIETLEEEKKENKEDIWNF